MCIVFRATLQESAMCPVRFIVGYQLVTMLLQYIKYYRFVPLDNDHSTGIAVLCIVRVPVQRKLVSENFPARFDISGHSHARNPPENNFDIFPAFYIESCVLC